MGMHRKREKKRVIKGMNGTPWHACSPFSLSFVLQLGFFGWDDYSPKDFAVTLAQKVPLLVTEMVKPLKAALWPKDVDKPYHFMSTPCLNYHLWELYVVRLRQCLKARAEPKYEIAQTLVFSSFKLTIMVLSVEKRWRARMSWHGELLINCGSFRVIILAASTLF